MRSGIKSFMNDKTNKNKLLKLIVSLIFLTILIYVFGLIHKVPIDSKFAFGTPDGWLGYAGGVIGGFLSLCGVYLTIKHEKEEKQKENETLYKPLIYIESIDNTITKNIKTIDISFALSNDIDYGRYITLNIANSGRGEAYISEIIAYMDEDSKNDQISDFFVKSFDKYVIPNNSKSKSIIFAPNIDLSNETDLISEYYVYIDIIYKDTFNRNTYKSHNTLVIRIENDYENALEKDKYIDLGNRNIMYISNFNYKIGKFD